MAVPLIDLSPQHAPLMDVLEAAFTDAVAHNRFVLGPTVEKFEEELAAYCGVAHAVGVSSGTDALIAALYALDVGPGDEVITTPFSFFATAGSIARVGAVPIFVDIDPATFNIDASQITAAITDKTKAIMPVHLFGQCTPMGPINAIASEHGLSVIEDAAQAIGARDMATDPKTSAGGYSDIGCLSFYPTKNLSAFGDGGACLTNDEALANKLKSIRQHGEASRYRHLTVGGNFRLDAIQAAMLSIKLPHLDGWTDARGKIACRYHMLLQDLEASGDVIRPESLPEMRHVYNQYTIRIAAQGDTSAHDRRAALMARMAEKQVGCKVYYPLSLHKQPCFAYLDQADKSLAETDAASDCVLSLPIFPGLSEAQQDEAVAVIREGLKIGPHTSPPHTSPPHTSPLRA